MYCSGCEPKILWNVSPPGMNCCEPSVRCSVMPLRKKSMPSVVMNDGTRRKVVITPLVSPTAAETTSATTIPSQSGRLCFSGSQSHQTSAGERAKTRPTARSISPQMSSITSPAAISAIGAIDSVMFLMLSPSRKTLFCAWKKSVSATATTKMLASRRRRSTPATRQPRSARRPAFVVASATASGRYETGYFCFEEEPSYRVFVVRYGLTFSLVTYSRPVFVSDGATRPPDSL